MSWGGNSIAGCYGYGMPNHEVTTLRIEVTNGDIDPWSGEYVEVEMNDGVKVRFADAVDLPTAAGDDFVVLSNGASV